MKIEFGKEGKQKGFIQKSVHRVSHICKMKMDGLAYQNSKKIFKRECAGREPWRKAGMSQGTFHKTHCALEIWSSFRQERQRLLRRMGAVSPVIFGL